MAPFREMAVLPPEPDQGGGQTQPQLSKPGHLVPLQRRPEVVMLPIEPVQPSRFLRSVKPRLGLLRQVQKKGGMLLSCPFYLTTLLQPLQTILPDRLQHPEARLPAPLLLSQ